jgi:hypothetical protein
MIPRPFEVQTPPEQAYVRNVLFAVELLDAVTLQRVSQGVEVTAQGLQGKPIVNSSGFFVWLSEDFTQLQELVVEPGRLPYNSVSRTPANVQRPLTSIELSPRPDYPFPSGTTGLLGTLIEERLPDPQDPAPVADAEVHLEWVDDLGVVQQAPTISRTNENGDFAVFIRFSPTDVPQLDPNKGTLTARLRAKRDSAGERLSADLQLVPGYVAEPATFPQGRDALIFAWDELHS